MKELFRKKMIELYQDVPAGVYEGLLYTLCIGAVLLLAVLGVKKGLKYTVGLLLVEYVFMLFCSTFFFRQSVESRGYDFTPFWSYYAIQEGKVKLLPENIMNVVVFLPVGLLFGCVFRNISCWRVLLFGAAISITIEALQYFYYRGFAETDDVMHNTLGCMMVFGVFLAIRAYGARHIEMEVLGYEGNR